MLISLRQIEKSYTLGRAKNAASFHALYDVNLEVDAGELLWIVGKSGSGKSTLLNLIAGLDTPSRGEIEVAGEPIHRLDEDSLAAFRGNNVGVVFQFFQLLPTLTILENVLLAMDFVNKVPMLERKERALMLLERVEVVEQAHKYPAELSGGQQQRVAIARALANDPPLIVADEPTGNLDSVTAKNVMRLFDELVDEGKTVLLVTHDPELGGHGEGKKKRSRVLTLVDGRIS